MKNMPGPITHLVFYKQLKERLSSDALRAMPGYDSDSVFAQGHDLLIYHDFYKIFSQTSKRTTETVQSASGILLSRIHLQLPASRAAAEYPGP